MQEIDKKYPSPETRAQNVWERIRVGSPTEEPTNWDLLCFAVHILGLFAAEHPWLEIPARHLNKMIYTAHYKFADEYFGGSQESSPGHASGGIKGG